MRIFFEKFSIKFGIKYYTRKNTGVVKKLQGQFTTKDEMPQFKAPLIIEQWRTLSKAFEKSTVIRRRAPGWSKKFKTRSYNNVRALTHGTTMWELWPNTRNVCKLQGFHLVFYERKNETPSYKFLKHIFEKIGKTDIGRKSLTVRGFGILGIGVAITFLKTLAHAGNRLLPTYWINV